jgi:UDP-glucose 4-epimerase
MRDNCESVFLENKIDIVVHLAAQTDVKFSIENPYIDADINIFGTINILSLCVKYGVFNIVSASSASVYGDINKLAKESDLKNPISPYGISKLCGEIYCQNFSEIYGLNIRCLRFANVYGERNNKGIISIIKQKKIDNSELQIYGDGNQIRDFINVKDIANAIYSCRNLNGFDIYNVSTCIGVSINELIDIFNIKNVKYIDAIIGDIKYSLLDNSKIKNALGWNPMYKILEGK